MKLFQSIAQKAKKLFQRKEVKSYPYVKSSGTIPIKETVKNISKIPKRTHSIKSGHNLRKYHFGNFRPIKNV